MQYLLQGRVGHGPTPVRNKQWPWGFPWAEGKAAQRMELRNVLMRFTLRCLQQIHTCDKHQGRKILVLLEHPEDLGVAKTRDMGSWPASIWQLPEKQFHSHLFVGIAAFCLFIYDGFRALRASYLTHLLVQPTIRRDVLCALTNKTEILKNAISKNLIPEAMGSYVYLHQRWDACYLAAST
jgi:hypothetical protein